MSEDGKHFDLPISDSPKHILSSLSLQVRVVITADVPLDQLFLMKKSDGIGDHDRVLMDDLNISSESVSYPT